MKKIVALKMYLIGLGLLSFLGCGGLVNQGIEVGNPDVTGKKITLVPLANNPIFVVRFDNLSSARITRVLSGVYETQNTTYQFENLLTLLQVFFSDGADVQIEMLFNSMAQLNETLLQVNELNLDNEFLQESPPFDCQRPEPNAAEALAQGLCSRLVFCGLQAACDTCETAVLDLPGLGASFGTPPGTTLRHDAEGLENGTVETDPEAFASCQADIEVIPCVLLVQGLDDNPDNLNPLKGLLPKPSCAKGVLKQK